MRQVSIGVLLAAALTGSAATPLVTVKNVKIERAETQLIVSMDIDASATGIGSDKEVRYRPVISDGSREQRLPEIVVAGRNRYIQNERHNTTADGAKLMRSGKSMSYSTIVPYSDWMERSELTLKEDQCECGMESGRTNSYVLTALDYAPAKKAEFEPMFAFVTPKANVRKTRTASGSAYIDYPVNKTAIDPTYRRNPEELAKIRSMIDAIKNDRDARITSVSIAGYASPEGPYAANAKLAAGRAESLAEYVRGLYAFDKSVMSTTSTPENWAGLREYVESHSSMADAKGILTIIDMTQLEPDAREWKLKKTYPTEYAYLLKEVYPGLRKSDYSVDYELRVYTDIDEIKQIMATAPQKLDLNEIYAVANTLEPGSDAYREALELAVRMYPEDETANLNMSSIALERNELQRAATYLSKAGNTAQATYGRGILAIKQGDMAKGKALIKQAAAAGLPEAANALEQLKEMGE